MLRRWLRQHSKATLSCGPRGCSRPWRCIPPYLARSGPDGSEVVMVDDASADRSRPAAGAFLGPRDWDHIPECGSDDLAVSVRWERAGIGLEGQIIVENISGHACRLSHKPWVIPLGTDGRELPVEALITLELHLDPVILDPGRRAAAPVGWAGWCGDTASGLVQVKWISGSTVVDVEGPRQPDCPDPGQPTNLSSSWFETLD
jgi:hypothetical protein